MQNLEYLKLFIEEKNKDLYVEVNILEKATIRPPCLILEPIKNKKKSKNRLLLFKAIYVDVEMAYNGIIAFSKKAELLLDKLENHEVFENNFNVLDREISWELQKSNEIEYYSAIAEYELDETLANKEDLKNYVMMKELRMGGNLNGDA
ncbi:MAG: hypothetical protein JXM74_04685 [Fusobacteriaceae bacterium]|nr:hypothetical protein [Fusobacteriaceae bacterium]MBN2838032.1 hypothetical protein [Fusobacteriaceae bacterium]